MTHRLSTLLAALYLIALPLQALAADEAKDRLGFAKVAEGESKGTCPNCWTCIIGGADRAMTVVKLSGITSISKQTYMLEGSQRILEVTIDTEGNNSIRFYCLHSAHTQRALERTSNTRGLASKYTEGALSFPSKKYPEATHSHNIEYQLSSPEQVNRIYESAVHAWVKNIPTDLRIGK